MFKTHLLQNKETIIGISVTIAVVVLLVINLVTLLPLLFEVSSPVTSSSNDTLIDAQVVNTAIELLQ